MLHFYRVTLLLATLLHGRASFRSITGCGAGSIRPERRTTANAALHHNRLTLE